MFDSLSLTRGIALPYAFHRRSESAATATAPPGMRCFIIYLTCRT